MDATAVSAITGAIDFTTIIVGVSAVFAAMVVLKVAIIGGRKLLSAIR